MPKFPSEVSILRNEVGAEEAEHMPSGPCTPAFAQNKLDVVAQPVTPERQGQENQEFKVILC